MTAAKKSIILINKNLNQIKLFNQIAFSPIKNRFPENNLPDWFHSRLRLKKQKIENLIALQMKLFKSEIF